MPVLEVECQIEAHQHLDRRRYRQVRELSARENGREYWAMGDNSYNSSDSRYWGAVPERNLVGPALLCYFPLGRNWGLIR